MTAETPTPGQRWQEAFEQFTQSYREQWQRAGLSWPKGGTVAETVQRLASATQEVTAARIGVAGEWLRAPLWLSGVASPQDLQQSYYRLFEARRTLVRAYLDTALGVQWTLTGATERAVEGARETVDAGVQRGRELANELRKSGEVATRAARVAGSAPPAETSGLIKGNINSRGEKIYHLPGQANYDAVQPEETFATESEAQTAGYRRAQR